MASMPADSAAVLLEGAFTALDAGDSASGEAILRESARRFPDDPEIALHFASLLRVLESEEAEDAFELSPEIVEYGLVLAEFHAGRDRFERARDVIAVALEHSPGDEWLLALRGALADWADG